MPYSPLRYDIVDRANAEDTSVPRPVIFLGPYEGDMLLDWFEGESNFAGAEACVPHTSRAQRDDEEDGVDYHFTSLAEMQSLRDCGELIEVQDHNGQL